MTSRLRRAYLAAGTIGFSLVLVAGGSIQSVSAAPGKPKPKPSAAAGIVSAARVMPLPAGGLSWSPNFGVAGPLWSSGYHTGQDFSATTGTPILAAAKGTVAFTGVAGPYGNLTRISHGDGVETWYAHQSKIFAITGKSVVPGQMIGAVGDTGNSTGPHLHFEVRVNGQTVDPNPWLTGAPAVPAAGMAGTSFDPALADELRGQMAEADDALSLATAQAATASAEQAAVDKKLVASQGQVDAAMKVLADYAREVYKTGIDPRWLLATEALSATNISDYTDREVLLQYANQSQNSRVSGALTELATAKDRHDESAALAAKATAVLDAANLKMADLQTRLDASVGVWQAGGQFDGVVPEGGSPAALKAVEFALSQLGAPYTAAGGTGPTYATNGFVYRTWHEAGSPWPLQKANDQAINTKWVVPVEPGDEMPGDLIFFRFDNGKDLPGRINHAGIVVNPKKGVFVHASSPRTGVELNNYKTTSHYQTPAMFGRVVMPAAAPAKPAR